MNATEKQVAFLTTLVGERPGAKTYVDTQLSSCSVTHPRELSSREISNVIGVVLGMPKAPAPGRVTEPGMYVGEFDRIFKVQAAVHGSGNLYAKELVDGEFVYAPGALRNLRSSDRMTIEQAKKYGALYGTCVVCGRTLTNEQSIAEGIGPVCSGRI